MVVACGLDLFPRHLLEPRCRQRRQQWLFLGAQLLPAGGAVGAAQVVVDLPDTLGDGVVQLLQRRPYLRLQVADDPLVDHVDGVLGGGLVAGLARAGRHHGGLVVVGELLVAGVDDPL